MKRHIDDAVAKGATRRAGRAPHELGGTFFEPTLLIGRDRATCRSRARRPSARSPRCSRFETEERGDRARQRHRVRPRRPTSSRSDLGRIWRVGEALEFGVVGVNTGLISYEGAPFGGVKESGLGREGSRHGIDEFTDIKYLCIDGLGA